MNFQFVSSSYDLLIHNVQDNILKVVRLDQSYSCDLDATIKEYVETLTTELDLENFEIKWPTQTKAEIYTTETRTKHGWIYNSSSTFDVLLYQIRPVEVFGSFSRPPVESETQTDSHNEEKEDNDTDTESNTDTESKDTDMDIDYKPLRSNSDSDSDSDSENENLINLDEPNPINPVYFKFQNTDRFPVQTYTSPFDQPCLFNWRQGQCDLFKDFPNAPSQQLQTPLIPPPRYDSLKSNFIAELTSKLACDNFGLSSVP